MRTTRYREQRRQAILDYLARRGEVRNEDLAHHLGVTGATVRKDLTALMADNKLIRTFGGAILPDEYKAAPLRFRVRRHSQSKRRIADAAAGLIGPNDTVALDASSSCLALASRLKRVESLTIVTNGLSIAREFSGNPAVKVLLAGGMVDHDSAACVGPETVTFFRSVRTSTAFVGAGGIRMDLGLGEDDPLEYEVKKAMVESADKTVALIDSSKWKSPAVRFFIPMADLHAVITDENADRGQLDRLRDSGIHIISV